ncbi:MAG: glycosyltransferase family 4 protein [Nocardioides alkalitolerans]
MAPDGRASSTVAIVQPFVPTYRAPLFDALADEMRQRGLTLEVWHDQPRGRVAARGNATSGPWSVPIKQRRLSVRGRNVTYRPVVRDARKAALVVAGLASGNVETYALAADRRVRLALWGHGRNFTAANNPVDAALEGWLIKRSRHVFVYTAAGAAHLEQSGVDPDKLSVVRNSTDTKAVVDARGSSSPESARRSVVTWPADGERVGLFVGAYDVSKRLPFLFESADLIHAGDPGFRLWVAGDGPERSYVAAQVEQRSRWCRLLPRLSPDDLGAISHLVDVVLMPGRVGLVAADALAMGVPIATTRHDFHAPEVEYLDESTSLWSDAEPQAYASLVSDYLGDGRRQETVREAARAAVRDISVEAAAQRFARGIDRALDR